MLNRHNSSPNKLEDTSGFSPRCLSGNPSIITEQIGSDNVFEDETDFSLPYKNHQQQKLTKEFTFNRSLSVFQAELPPKNCRLRRFTVHSRDNFTNAWLNIHDFRKNDINTKASSFQPIILSKPLSSSPSSSSSQVNMASNTSSMTITEDNNGLIPSCIKNDSMKDEKDNQTILNAFKEDEKMSYSNDDKDIEKQDPTTMIYGMNRKKSLSLSNASSENDTPSTTTTVIDHSERWIDNLDAKNSVIVALTVFYALIMTIFALVFELSHLLSGEDKRAFESKDLIFGLYMYVVSIIFLIYCYIVLLLNPRWTTVISKLKSWARFRKYSSESSMTLDGESSVAAATIHRKVTHDSPSAGSLFLRFGSVVFGVIGTVFYAFSGFLCLNDPLCTKMSFAVDACAIIFIFIQMHFVFCNWKMTIMGHHTIARFGTMHLVAANIWTWIRYVLIEESVMDKEIRHIFTDHSALASLNDSHHGTDQSSMQIGPFIQQSISSRITRSALSECNGSEIIDCVLGSIADIMYTAIVEYSLIGAVVMFIVWKNIDHVRQTPTAYVKRKHQIRVDCSKTTSGLFAGLAFLAATFTSMAVFYGYSLTGDNTKAAYVFSITDIIQYVIASLACIYALYQMRQLRYFHSSDARPNVNPSQELLDLILLSLGMIGEMIYSVAGLVGLTGDKHWQTLSVVLLTCHITRLMQVGLQCCLIYIAGKLRIKGDIELRKRQPGKQVITFLLIANIAMFLMNLFESEKAGISETVVNFYGKKSWVFLVRSFSPLTIFYRFHSSVCFAEVWKNAYAWKD